MYWTELPSHHRNGDLSPHLWKSDEPMTIISFDRNPPTESGGGAMSEVWTNSKPLGQPHFVLYHPGHICFKKAPVSPDRILTGGSAYRMSEAKDS